MAFSFGQPQQNQQQQQQQQQPQQANQFGGFNSNSNSNSNSASTSTASASPFTLNHLTGNNNNNPQSQQSNGFNQSQNQQGKSSFSGFQSSSNSFNSQNNQQNQQFNQNNQWNHSQFQQSQNGNSNGNNQHQSGGQYNPAWGSSASAANTQLQSLQPQQPQQQSEPQMIYVPGYLSKVTGAWPYSTPARSGGSHSPPHTRDDAPSSTSPNARFSWSGGAGSSDKDRERERSTSTTGGPQSLFGTGGLRGSRRGNTPGLGNSVTGLSSSRSGELGLHASSSPPKGGAFDEDDDPPPIEGLVENAYTSQNHGYYQGQVSNFGASTSARKPRFGSSVTQNGDGDTSFNPFIVNNSNVGSSSSPARPSSSTSIIQSNSNASSAPLSQRTVILYGFPSSLSHAVLDHFTNMGETESSSLFNPNDPSSTNSNGNGVESIKLVYLQPWSALRAIKRSGEMIASSCFVGVRFLDDSLNREVLLNGVTSNFFSGIGNENQSNSHLRPSSSSRLLTNINSGTPSSAHNSALIGTGTGIGGRSLRDASPSFGTPINVVGTPGAGLKNTSKSSTSTPIRSSGIGAATPPANIFNSASNSPAVVGAKEEKSAGSGNGIRGRIENAIFGW